MTRPLRPHARGNPRAGAKECDGRNALHAILCGDVAIRVDVHLDDAQVVSVSSREQFEFGCNHFARTTPTRPEVDDYRNTRVEDLTLKGGAAIDIEDSFHAQETPVSVEYSTTVLGFVTTTRW